MGVHLMSAPPEDCIPGEGGAQHPGKLNPTLEGDGSNGSTILFFPPPPPPFSNFFSSKALHTGRREGFMPLRVTLCPERPLKSFA